MGKHDSKSLKGRLAYAMEFRGFGTRGGQTKLAKKAGVRQPSISDILTGKTLQLRAKTLMLLADALDINHRWLQSNRGPMEKLTKGKPLSKALQDEIDDITDGYVNAPPEVRSIVRNDILAKYMSKNREQNTTGNDQ